MTDSITVTDWLQLLGKLGHYCIVVLLRFHAVRSPQVEKAAKLKLNKNGWMDG